MSKNRMPAFELRDILETLEAHNQPSEKENLEDVSDGPGSLLTGMSGRRFRTLVSELVSHMDNRCVYMEIGIYQALTCFVAGFLNPDKTIVGVDDYSQFDFGGQNFNLIKSAIHDNKLSNIQIYNKGFEEFLSSDTDNYKEKVGIFFFDAAHDYRSQFLALFFARDFLANGGVIIVDDTNYPHIRQATADFLKIEPEFKLLFEAYTGKHPTLGLGPASRWDRFLRRFRYKSAHVRATEEHERLCREGWWNGVNLLIHDPQNQVDSLVPNTPANLTELFRMQHGFAGCDSRDCKNQLANVSFNES